MPGYKEIDIHERWIEHKFEYDEQEKKEEQEMTNQYAQDSSQQELTEDEELELAIKDWESKRQGTGETQN